MNQASLQFPQKRHAGSVLLVVLMTLVFATAALLMFIEKASADLLVPIREADANRLRLEAYSALETTLAVLEDFREVAEGLHSPAEGWGEPLEFAGYEPGEGRTVEVELEDESAKLSLPEVKPDMLVSLLEHWGLPNTQAEAVADSLLVWMSKDYTPTNMDAATPQDYERLPLPAVPPMRSLRSFAELASIEGVRQVFFDEDGTPNELHQRFVDTFSLYRFRSPNINGGRLEPLLAKELFDEHQIRRVQEYLTGGGTYQTQGPGFFKNARSVSAVSGADVSRLGYGMEVTALRVTITVREGVSSFRLSAVVAPAQGGAKVVRPSNPTASGEDSAEAASGRTGVANTPATAVPEQADLKYPFTFLEIRENDSAAPPAAEFDDPLA